MSELISIIVPVYNTEQYLSECIESIISQTYKNIEIILVNDGSTDNSLEICKKYASKDNRIKVINKTNGGVTSARKLGMLNAMGDYIGFVDSDDYVSLDMYEKFYNKIIENDADIVISTAYYRVSKNNTIYVNLIEKENIFDMENLNNDLYKDIFSYLSGSLNFGLYKKECIEPYILNLDERIAIAEDLTCVFQSVINAKSVYFFCENMYYYRKNSNSVMNNKNPQYLGNLQYVYTSLIDSVKKQQNKDMLVKQIYKRLYIIMVRLPEYLFETHNYGLYIFPFEKIKPNSNIIIYGAGNVGKSYRVWIEKTGYCNLTLWVDNNYIKISELGYNVFSPDKMLDIEFDYILIAQKYESVSNEIAQGLIKKYNIDKEKIICHEPKELSDFIIL